MAEFRSADHGHLWRAPQRRMLAARLGLDRNPLRPRSDLLQTAVFAAAMLMTCAAIPLSVFLGIALRESWTHQAHRQTAAYHRVSAFVVEEAGPQGIVDPLPADSAPWAVHVRWTGQDGTERGAWTDARGRAQPGGRITIWTTADDRIVPPPWTPVQIAWRAVLAALSLQMAVTLVIAAGYAGTRWVLDRRRYHRWDDEWARLNSGPTG